MNKSKIRGKLLEVFELLSKKIVARNANYAIESPIPHEASDVHERSEGTPNQKTRHQCDTDASKGDRLASLLYSNSSPSPITPCKQSTCEASMWAYAFNTSPMWMFFLNLVPLSGD
ncbi:hypothetical protein QAD02_023574 [Eretmocerus hayati]|uniref:Uncharacterized protein n=1 Tax=Eretmocerus hayati TaxID=131215 RepID=A0ACC2Q152_9HYME|nr:hypothetical protein QAD02_023574 [Eretmocerus hayati]